MPSIDYSKDLTLAEFDAMGYWRCSRRRRSLDVLRKMTPQQSHSIAMIMTEGRRRVARARLGRRRPEITEEAIRDLIVNHLLRRSDREREIAARCARMRKDI